jgi:hypothetical protein
VAKSNAPAPRAAARQKPQNKSYRPSADDHGTGSHTRPKPPQFATRCGEIERAGAACCGAAKTAKLSRGIRKRAKMQPPLPFVKKSARGPAVWHAGCISCYVVGDLRVSDTH